MAITTFLLPALSATDLAEITVIAEQAPWELRLWAQTDGDRPETYGHLVKEAAAISVDLETLARGDRLPGDTDELMLELNDHLIRVLLVRVPLEAAIDRPDPDLAFWLETVGRPAAMHLAKLTHALHRAVVHLGG